MCSETKKLKEQNGQLLTNYSKFEQIESGLSADLKDYNQVSKWTGKVWYAIGDSITERNEKTSKNYYDYIKDIIKCTVNIDGQSGTGWFTPNIPTAANQIFNRIQEQDAKADLITVFAGTNDIASIGKEFVLGKLGDTNPYQSFYGALDYTIKLLISKFPTKTIAVITPLQRDISDHTFGHVTKENMISAVDAIIEVAGGYSIPALDVYRYGNMYPWDLNFKMAAMPDGLHPNELGHQILADKILAFFNTL